ncbi:MAG TPA: SRPBCC domain-containing protein [Pedobacter sp.]|nr:SRPBCC domain-containing protein [Pedobacter sp.]
MDRTIKHIFTFDQKPEVVWDYLTKPELLELWLMQSNFKPVVGEKFEFKTKAIPRFGFDGNIYCKVTEIIPFEKLSYTWRGGNPKETNKLDSVVVWTLTAKDGGTVLVLEHKGFKGLKNFFSYLVMNKGWLKIGKRLTKKLNETIYDESKI